MKESSIVSIDEMRKEKRRLVGTDGTPMSTLGSCRGKAVGWVDAPATNSIIWNGSAPIAGEDAMNCQISLEVMEEE